MKTALMFEKTDWIFLSDRPLFISTDYDIFEVDDLLSHSKYLWTFDDANDVKDLQGIAWAEVSGTLQTTSGVRRRAVKVSGDAGPIRLSKDTWTGLIYPAIEDLTISLWIRYQSKGPGVIQTFLAVGNLENGDKGTYLYQKNGSMEELTFEIVAKAKSCSFTFGVPQRIWRQLVFTRKISDGINGVKVYRNGKLLTSVVRHCYGGRDIQNDKDIKLGSSQLPLASFDDLVVWNMALTELQVEKLFRFYKGRLYSSIFVNLSVG